MSLFVRPDSEPPREPDPDSSERTPPPQLRRIRRESATCPRFQESASQSPHCDKRSWKRTTRMALATSPQSAGRDLTLVTAQSLQPCAWHVHTHDRKHKIG